MRINKFVARASGLSRRGADAAIEQGKVLVDGQPATLGQEVDEGNTISLNGKTLVLPSGTQTILLYKPAGYVVSRDGQGSKTVYDLLPPDLHNLKPVGRLDKDSSGLLLLTSDGELANTLTHPKFAKTKIYEVELDKPLAAEHKTQIEQGVELEDGPSRFAVEPGQHGYRVTLTEGRNRQIRRTFAAVGYTVTKLHRTQFGDYKLEDIAPGAFLRVGV